MNKKGIAFLIILIVFISGCSEEKESFPERKEEFEIQGAQWRTLAYFYHPFIYEQVYNKAANNILLKKARYSGINYLSIRVLYNSSPEGVLVKDDKKAEKYIKQAVEMAHNYNISIFLNPFVESVEFMRPDFHWIEWGDNETWTLSKEVWEEEVVKWAKFAEENNVEMFAPGFEMSLMLNQTEAKEFYEEILPKIKEVYHGKVAFAEIPYDQRFIYLDEHNVFRGYDCVGITVFPWEDYNGTHDMRGFEDLRKHLERQSMLLNDLGDKYNTSCRIIATYGMDDWYGGFPNTTTRAKGYSIGFDVFKEYNLTGVFIHIWASEDDHLGRNKDVENMLNKRWIKRE